MAPKLKWRLIAETYAPTQTKPDGFTYRAKVPGGWLVTVWAGTMKNHGQGGGITFVPDPEHAWKAKARRDPSDAPSEAGS